MVCDRCNKEIEGSRFEGWTVGFYDVGLGSAWSEYRQGEELKICDSCMWNDPKYVMGYEKIGGT